MSDFGYKPPQFRLLNQQLTLSPDTIAMIHAIESEMAARRTINLWLKPDWSKLDPDLSRILLTPPPQPPASPFTVPRGAGPDTPRKGEISDLLKALWQVPIAQTQVHNVYSEAHRQFSLLKRECQTGSPNCALTISMTGLVVGSSLGFLMAAPTTRQGIFNLVVNRDIPVPGVDGLSFKILQRGGQITTPTPVSGLTLTGGLNFRAGGGIPDYNFMVNLDVLKLLRSRNVNF